MHTLAASPAASANGTVVIVETNSVVEPGDIVVAALDGQVTVTLPRKARDDSFFLEPANPTNEPIHPRSSLGIVGLVTGSSCTIKKRR